MQTIHAKLTPAVLRPRLLFCSARDVIRAQHYPGEDEVRFRA